MAYPKVLPVSEILNIQKQVSLVVTHKSFDQKESKIAQLKLDNEQKIQDFIENNLGQFGIKDKTPSLYGLRLCETHQYINEKNRKELLALKDGKRFHEVELCFNLKTEVRNFIDKVSSYKVATHIEEISTCFVNIQPYINADKLFAHEIFTERGQLLVIGFIKDCDKLSDPKKWRLILNLYKTLICFIQKWKLTTWDGSEIDLPVIQLIADTVNESVKENHQKEFLVIPDDLVLFFLQIIDDILINSQETRKLMLRDLKLKNIVFLIQRQNSDIKETLLVLLNNMFSQNDPEILKSLQAIFSQPQHVTLLREEKKIVIENFNVSPATRPIVKGSTKSVIDMPIDLNELITTKNNLGKTRNSLEPAFNRKNLRGLKNNDFNSTSVCDLNSACKDDRYNTEIILENFQILQKNILDIDMGNKLKSPAESGYLTKLKLIADKAFETSTSDKDLSYEEKFKQLGFVTPSDPISDFQKCPPGVLPLEFMVYFAERHGMKQTDFVSEKMTKNSDYLFPFAKASIAMIKLLCRILSIGDKQTIVGDSYKFLFLVFTLNNDGINEFFAKCLGLFKRLWFDMKAQSLDFERALLAFEESLDKMVSEAHKLHLDEKQAYNKSINDFIETWKYDNLKVLRNNDKSNREPIKHAKKILTKELLDMLKPKRMKVLIKGEKFDKFIRDRRPSKHKQVWKLQEDHKVFTFKDYDNNEKEVMSNRIEVEKIQSVSKETVSKDAKNGPYFALHLKTIDANYLLGSSREETVDFWHDAIKILIKSEPGEATSEAQPFVQFVECLIATQLLDLKTLGFDGEIPHEIPDVPDLPSDFDFQYIKIK